MDKEELIISSAKIDQEKRSEYPDVEESFSYENFEKYILNSKENFGSLNNIIRKLEFDELSIRFNTWRILLGALKADSNDEEKKATIEKDRQIYKDLWEKYKQKQQPNEPEKPKPVFNPLAKNITNSPWNGYFEDNELRSEIKKDVERTYQDKQFFVNLKIKSMLTNILFVFCKKNSDVGYRQGMNEVAASFIIVYFVEALYIQKHNKKEEGVSERAKEMAQFMMDINNAEADIYTVFTKMMEIGHLEMFRPNLAENNKKKQEYNINSKKQQAILIRISKIQDNYLKIVDLELFKHMKLLNVEFQIFLLRWIRCLHTREYHLEDSFQIWDNIFFEYFLNPVIENDFFLIDCICLAMMQYVRGQLMEKEEQSECLQRFLKYPPVENIKPIIDVAFKIKDILTKGLNEKEGLFLQQQQSKEQDKQDNNVVKSKQQGNKNLILFSSGFASKSSNISQPTQQIKEPSQVQVAKKSKRGIFDESSSDEDNNNKPKSQQQNHKTQESKPIHAKSTEPHKAVKPSFKQRLEENDDDEDEDNIPAPKNPSGTGFPVANFSHKAASVEPNSNEKKSSHKPGIQFPNSKETEEQQQPKTQSFVPSYNNNVTVSSSFSSKDTSSSNNNNQDFSSSVTLKSTEITSMTKKISGALDTLNYLFSKDIKNENLKKAIEDIEYVERELKKKQVPSTTAPIFGNTTVSTQSFVTSSSSSSNSYNTKPRPILFSSGNDDSHKNSVKIQQSTGFVVYKSGINN